MPLLGFQKQFADKVESGEKRQTIRAYRKDGRDPKVGDTLYLYTGLRTKGSRKLGEATCTHSYFALVDHRDLLVGDTFQDEMGREMHARRDGFSNFEEMQSWFDKTHGLPFRGLLIRWGDLDG